MILNYGLTSGLLPDSSPCPNIWLQGIRTKMFLGKELTQFGARQICNESYWALKILAGAWDQPQMGE